MISCLRFNVAIFFCIFINFFFQNNFLLLCTFYEVAFQNKNLCFCVLPYVFIIHFVGRSLSQAMSWVYGRKMWSFMYFMHLLKKFIHQLYYYEQFLCFYSIRKEMKIAFRNSNIY